MKPSEIKLFLKTHNINWFNMQAVEGVVAFESGPRAYRMEKRGQMYIFSWKSFFPPFLQSNRFLHSMEELQVEMLFHLKP